MIRFSSVAVPFASRSIVLPAGHVLTTEQVASLVRLNAGAAEVALISADRPTLVAATKAFRAALAPKVTPAPTASPAVLAAQDEAIKAASHIVRLQARVAELEAEVAALKAPKAKAPRRSAKAKAEVVPPTAS